MKARILGYGLMGLALASPSIGLAQEDKGGREGAEGRGREMLREPQRRCPAMMGAFMQNIPVLAALDADKDGSLSATEIANASKALMTLDKNGEGY